MAAQRVGQLYTRAGGQGHYGVVLLHGLVGTGDVFSVAADALAGLHRVAVPEPGEAVAPGRCRAHRNQ